MPTNMPCRNRYHISVDTLACISPLTSDHDEPPAEAPSPAVPLSPRGSKEVVAAKSATITFHRIGCDQQVDPRFHSIGQKYDIDPHVLGAGRHGAVRLCVDRASGRRYAVKSVRKGGPADRPGRLNREVGLLRDTNHRNIVRLVDVYEDAWHVHVVTDLCEGGELFARLVDRAARGGDGEPCFAEDEAARIVRQVLAAVSYLHSRGVVHRDLKLENILFASTAADSPVKIIDFGFARKHFVAHMTSTVGTPYYIAPEVLQGKYDKACDLWSVGVIAFMLLSGTPPFDGDTDAEVLEAVRCGHCRFPSRKWSGVSREGTDFVRRLLRKDTGQRMTAEQALNHPWAANHASEAVATGKGHHRHKSSVEVLDDRSRAHSIMFVDIDTQIRKGISG